MRSTTACARCELASQARRQRSRYHSDMDPALTPVVAAILSAGIPALVAAATFAYTQLSGRSEARRSAQYEAFMKVFGELERVGHNLTRPAIVAKYTKPDLALANAVSRLALHLPKRDYSLWMLLMGLTLDLGQAHDIDRVKIASQMQGTIVSHLTNPRETRKRVPDIAAAAGLNIDWQKSGLTHL